MTHPGFLQAICEHPDDDAHRLIYADWLDDHGDADRAEFIRLQCALAAMDDEDEAMQAREAELLREHGDTWRDELPSLPKVDWWNAFRRGFVAEASVTHYAAWRKQGLAMLAATPLETLTIWHVTPYTVRRLARSSGIERVRGIAFPTGGFRDEDLELLGKACRLRAFSYNRQSAPTTVDNLAEDAGRILASSPGFRGIRHLSLDSIRLGDAGAACLVAAPNLAELESLRLAYCDLTSAGVCNLLRNTSWTRLRVLDLSINNISDDAARKIASCPGLSGLRKLDLGSCDITNAGVTALARSLFLTNLRELDLSECPIYSESVEALITSLNLCELRSLSLGSTPLTAQDIVALLRSSLGANLHELDASDILIDVDSAAAIVSTPGLDDLASLTVSAGEGTDLLRQRFGDRITIL